MLLLCNPHNPLAIAYQEDVIRAYASLAEEFNLHLVVDEVFANQVFPTKYSPSPIPFRSILSLSSLPCTRSRVHVVCGPTKDLGASGIKLGSVISQDNRQVLLAIASGLSVTPLSSASDAIFTQIIEDELFFDEYLEKNRKALSSAFELLARWCEGHNFPCELLIVSLPSVLLI